MQKAMPSSVWMLIFNTPPSEIVPMLNKYEEGFQVVKMIRSTRKDGSLLRKAFTSLFYWGLNKVSKISFEKNASDFFLISKEVANDLKNDFKERNRFLRGLIQLIGYNQTKIEYHAPERFAGASKYSIIKLLRFSLMAISNSTISPLKLGLVVGVVFGLFSFLLGGYSLFMYISNTPLEGYTTLIVFLSFAFGILFILIGIIGEYIGRIYIETKNRPLYLVREKVNL